MNKLISFNKNTLIVISTAIILIILALYFFPFNTSNTSITNNELLNLKTEVSEHEKSQNYCKYLIKEYYTFLKVINSNQKELQTMTESEEYLSAFKKFIVLNNNGFLKRVLNYEQEPTPLPKDLENFKTKYTALIKDNTDYYKKTSLMFEANEISPNIPNNTILMSKSYEFFQILDSSGSYLTDLSIRLMKKYDTQPEIE